MYKKKVKVPIYGGEILFMITDSVADVKKAFPFFDKDSVWAHAFTLGSGEMFYGIVINVSSHDNGPYLISNIAHESLHVANYIASDVGMHHDVNNDESMAYLTGWISKELYKFIYETTIKPSAQG